MLKMAIPLNSNYSCFFGGVVILFILLYYFDVSISSGLIWCCGFKSGEWNSLSLPLLSSPLWPGVVSVRVPSMVQIGVWKLFDRTVCQRKEKS